MPIFVRIQMHGAANIDEGDIFPPHPDYIIHLPSLTPQTKLARYSLIDPNA